jgi:hypothetical protein
MLNGAPRRRACYNRRMGTPEDAALDRALTPHILPATRATLTPASICATATAHVRLIDLFLTPNGPALILQSL